MRVHYKATHYPGTGSVFAIVLDEDNSRHGLTSAWTIRQCSDYAKKGGFTVETARHEDGVTVFSWRAERVEAVVNAALQ